MRTILYMCCFFYMIVRADIMLRLRIILHPEDLHEWVTASQKRVARLIFLLAPLITEFRIQVEPYRFPLPPAFLLVSNHQSLADIPALVYAFPRHALRFVIKRELGRGIPMVSLYTRIGGHALISRSSDYGEGKRELEKLAERSASGICPVVFPEGTRSRTGKLKTFYAGAFRIILGNSRLPVLSVAVDGGYRISRLTRIFTNLNKTRYKVKPLTLYPSPEGRRETLGLLGRVEAEIAAQIKAWRAIEK
jgi:1-acyl-sn-glycerol-3-phosphate acyltransferase